MQITSFDSPEATAFRDEVRDWASRVVPPEWRELDGIVPEETALRRRGEWDALVRDGGYAGLSWPSAYGGRGLGIIEEFIFYEEVATAGAPDMLNFIGQDLAGPAIINFGTEQQQAELLPRILSGEHLWCEGFSEPDAGSDLAAASTTALVGPNDEYVVNGQKTWTSLAHIADMCYVLARTSLSAPRHHNLSVLLLEMRQPGVEVRSIVQITGDREFNDVFFSDARVPGHRLLGAENDGWQLASLAGFRRDRRIFDALRRYVIVERILSRLEQAPGLRADAQAVAALRVDLDLLRWHIRRCTELRVHGLDVSRSSTILRVLWSELWQRVVQVGLDGGADEAFWRHEFLHARSVTIAGGTTQIQRNVIADRVLGLPR